jgi:hypothetical protein
VCIASDAQAIGGIRPGESAFSQQFPREFASIPSTKPAQCRDYHEYSCQIA